MNFQQFSASERRLIAVAGILVGLMLNYAVLKFFINNRSQIREATERKKEQLATLDSLASQSPLWAKRDQWLKAIQPKLESEAQAGNELLNFLKELAARNGLSLSKQQLASSKNESFATTIPVVFELKGNWKGFCQFLIDLQAPERFVVVQQARLKVDSSDATAMFGEFTVAKWFSAN